MAASHKDRSWEYEREWRLVKPDAYFFGPRAVAGEPMPMPPARRLLLGARISAAYEARLIAVAKTKAIPVCRMKPGRTADSLEIEPV
jgi:hypothetical protein